MKLKNFKDELQKIAVSETLLNLAKNRMLVGAATGGLGGAAVGAATGEEGTRKKRALTMGAIGAIAGGMYGHFSRPVDLPPVVKEVVPEGTPRFEYMKSTPTDTTKTYTDRVEKFIDKDLARIRDAANFKADGTTRKIYDGNMREVFKLKKRIS
jgi:hypothetical protein